MNNYSWLQQKLHKFALTSNFMREITFDLESSLVTTQTNFDDHIFVAGLARSGTTILLNALYDSKEFATLSYSDMPFILAPNLWSKLHHNRKEISSVERAHGDGIEISIESPEAFEEVFWKTFSDEDLDTADKFKNYVQLIIQNRQKKRYLSKNNQNIRRLGLISEIFPNSKILIPFRNPIQQSNSLLYQHKNFINLSEEDKFVSNYMKLIGHTEFGPTYVPIHDRELIYEDDLDLNHWLEQWYKTYKSCFESLAENKNVFFICYEKLCKSEEYWSQMLEILGINKNYKFEFIESKKIIKSEVNKRLKQETSYLYSQLSDLPNNK